ncbi:MAG: O-antigen ligase family protein [Gaiellaceae bacterium]
MRSRILVALRSPNPALLLTSAVAVSLFAIAYDNGSYGLPSRGTLAIALWWAISMSVAFGIVELGQMTRPAKVIAGLLAALCLWTLLSVVWAPSAENAFNEFNRVSLFLAVFLLISLAARYGKVDRWVDGLTLAIVAIALVALTSRLFPGLFPDRGIFAFLPKSAIRLNFPLGYWNGLATLTALGIPLALRVAIGGRNSIVRGIALASLPVVASVIYLASSRGGALTAFVGVVVFFALSEHRWSIGAALVVGGLGSAGAIAVLRMRHQLVDGPLGTGLVERQGRAAAFLILLVCALTAAVYALGSRYLRDRIRPSRRLGQTLVASIALLLIVGVIASHPIRRFEQFKRPAQANTVGQGYSTSEHFLSGSGNGRWQMWSAALDQWQQHPLVGNGAGSYAEWWTRHGSIAISVKDAHSLYLETLGELGLVGFLLLAPIFAIGAFVSGRRCLRAGDGRVTLAALTAAFGAYTVEVAIDWMWELTVVSIVAWAILALALSSLKPVEQNRKPKTERRSLRLLRERGPLVATVVVAWLLIAAQTIPLLAQTEIERSQAAVTRGDAAAAENAAMKARRIQPWAASPALQLALVMEQEGKLAQASAWIREAIKHNKTNWSLWLVSTRIDVKQGEIGKAKQSLSRAIELNPRSWRMIQLERTLNEKAPAAPRS